MMDLAARWPQGLTPTDEYQAALEHIPQCPFLLGLTKSGKWKANPDWFLRPDSVTKIMEGQYDGDNPTTSRDYGKGF